MNHRTATRSAARLASAGGALFALGNLLHPLEHGDAAESAATWEAAHLIFAAGAVLICAGVHAMITPMAHHRLARVGAALTWLAMLLIPVGAYFEVFVATYLPYAVVEDIEGKAAAFTILQTLVFIAGPVALGIAAFKTRTWPVAARYGLVVSPLPLLLAPALPGEDGVWIILGTVLLGASLALAGAFASATGRSNANQDAVTVL